MVEPKFKIGDDVYYASFESYCQSKITCQDCFGNKYLTVILGDDSKVTVECTGCRYGYDEPQGYHVIYEAKSCSELVTIERMEIQKDSVEYGFKNCYRAKEDRLFKTKEEADLVANILIEKNREEQLQRVKHKEKNTRSWAWNATYHRGRIRQANKDLEYHTAKLDVAKIKAKEKKEIKDGN